MSDEEYRTLVAASLRNERPHRSNLLSTLLILILIAVGAILLVAALPYAQKALSSYVPAPTTVIIATQRPSTTGGGRTTTTNPAPVSAPIDNPNVANSPAEADALYATAVAAQSAPAPDPNAITYDKPALPAAIAMPTISAAQAESYSNRGSGGCAEGQVFVPRVGCHTPGSGGAMPGSVGAP
jgi:hypothetical protein